MSMKVVVVGAGTIGYRIAQGMSEKNKVYVIESNPDHAAHADELDVQTIVGSGASPAVLEKVLPADIFVAVTDSDEINLLSCLNAKLMTKDRIKTIARVSSPDYIDKPVSEKEEFGVDVIVCPELALADEINTLLSIDGAIDAEHFADGKVRMIEFVIAEDNRFIGKKFKDVSFSNYCIVSAILRRGNVIIPKGEDYLMPGDHAFIICRDEDIDPVQTLFGHINEDRKEKKRVMIVGCGDIGLYLAGALDKNEKVILKIIEEDSERCMEIADRLPNSLILNSDATDVDTFEEEGVSKMDAVIALTGSDEKNLLCCLMAKHFGAGKVFARASRPDYLPIFEMVGIDVALSTGKTTTSEVLRMAAGTSVETLRTIANEKAEVLEYIATDDSMIIDTPLKEINFPEGAIVSMIVRGMRQLVPTGDTEIERGDRVIILSKPEAYAKVSRMFK
ncbi:MAG: Trk system potassium transporter TrkA [Methanosarcinaceae archaeon]|nr:Trk system potassium transporter TrkA [Methanosarcinaceae archaeon]